MRFLSLSFAALSWCSSSLLSSAAPIDTLKSTITDTHSHNQNLAPPPPAAAAAAFPASLEAKLKDGSVVKGPQFDMVQLGVKVEAGTEQGVWGYAGTLCGWHHNDPNYGSQSGLVTQVVNCGWSDPKTGCPGGWSSIFVCDDNGNWCGTGWWTCVNDNPVATSNMPPGTFCGVIDSDTLSCPTCGGMAANAAASVSAGKTQCWEILNSGMALGYKVQNFCPSGFSQVQICDDNGNWCNSATVSCMWTGGPPVDINGVAKQYYPTGTLCGAYSTDYKPLNMQGYPCNSGNEFGQGAGTSLSCPAGTHSMYRCDDNGNWCGAAVQSCTFT